MYWTLGTSFEETKIILQYRSISLENQLELQNLISKVTASHTKKIKPIDLYIDDYHYCTMTLPEEEYNIVDNYRNLSREGQLEIIEIFGLTEKLNSEPESRKRYPGIVEGSFTDPKRSHKRTESKIKRDDKYPSALHQYIAERELRKLNQDNIMSENTRPNSINKNISGRNLFHELKKIPTIKDFPAKDWSIRHEVYADLSEDEIELLSNYSELDEHTKEQVLKFIRSLIK